jgi:HK97 family phage prohead protease
MPVAAVPQTKSLLFTEVKAFDDAQGIFEGYLSVFGNTDSYKDIVEPGAFQKTINDARGRSSKYLFPVLWQHDPREPIGGFLDMKEDRKGLFVRAQLDLNAPLGQRAYSGLKMGYLDGLSIGYDTIKHKYISDVRHLLEVRMWEGSVVTFPANDLTRVSQVKGACGSPDWPLGNRNAAWDGSAAHKELVAWATNDAGELDAGKMKSVHFYVTDGQEDAASGYKMPFCRIREGSPVAIPKAITTCASVMQGAMGGGDFAGADGAMKSHIASYYAKMAKAFHDTSLVPPWEEKTAKVDAPRDFHAVLSDREPDQLMEELYDLVGALISSILENLSLPDPADTDVNDPAIKTAIGTCLDQFRETILDWTDDALSLDLAQPDQPVTKNQPLSLAHFTLSTRAMKWAMRSYVKEGRTISAINKNRITAALDAISKAIGDLQNLIGTEENEYDPGDGEPNPPPANDGAAPEIMGKDAHASMVVQEAAEPEPGEALLPEEHKGEEEPTEEMLDMVRSMRLARVR